MTRSRKLGVAGFVAGVISTALIGGTSLITGNIFVRCGALLASIGVCYFIYQFGDLRSASVASRRAWDAVKDELGPAHIEFAAWIKKPHPFAHIAIAIATSFMVLIVANDLHYGIKWGGVRYTLAEFGARQYVSLVVCFWASISLIGTFCVAAVSSCGASSRGETWNNEWAWHCTEKVVPLTYARAYKWFFLGLFQGIKFLFWTSWKIAFGYVARFLVELIRIIHSNERLMVSVDGPIGGLASMGCYWLYNRHADLSGTALEYGLVLIFGGIFASALVLANARYVAPRFGYGVVARQEVQGR